MPTSIATFQANILPYVQGCPPFVIDKEIVNTIVDFAKHTEIFRYDFNYPVYSSEPSTYNNDEIRVSLNSIDANKRPVSLQQAGIGSDLYTDKDRQLQNRVPANNICERDSLYKAGRKFYYVPANDKQAICIWPVEASEISEAPTNLFLDVVMVPLDTITTIDDQVYDDWHETIEFGALARLLRMPKKQWTDLGAVRAYYDMYLFGRNGAAYEVFKKTVRPDMKPTGHI